MHGNYLELLEALAEALLDPLIPLSADAPGVQIRLARVEAQHAQPRVCEINAATSEQLREVLVAYVPRVMIAEKDRFVLAMYRLDQPVRLSELLAKPHVGKVARDHDDVGLELVKLVDDTLGQRRDVVSRPAVQVRDVRYDRRPIHVSSGESSRYFGRDCLESASREVRDSSPPRRLVSWSSEPSSSGRSSL